MCKCCENANPETIAFVLIVTLFISFALSFASAFLMTSSTKQYKESLEILEQSYNIFFLIKFPRNCFEKPIIYDPRNIYSDCYVGEEKLAIQRKEITNKLVYKKYKTIELTLKILRIIIIFLFMISFIVLFIYLKKSKDSNNVVPFNKYLNIYFSIIVILSYILTFISFLLFFFSLEAISTFHEIGLYKISSNEFKNSIIINISINGINMFISIIIIFISCFANQIYNKIINRQESNNTNTPNGFNSPNNNDQNTQQNQGNYEGSAQNNSIRISPMENNENNINIIQSEGHRIQQNS